MRQGVPHVDLAIEYQPHLKSMLVGRTRTVELGDKWVSQMLDDGWTDSIRTLEELNLETYGILRQL